MDELDEMEKKTSNDQEPKPKRRKIAKRPTKSTSSSRSSSFEALVSHTCLLQATIELMIISKIQNAKPHQIFAICTNLTDQHYDGLAFVTKKCVAWRAISGRTVNQCGRINVIFLIKLISSIKKNFDLL